MSRPINITSAVTFHPTGTATGANITGSTSYPYSNGYNGTSNTSSYARLRLNANSTTTDCYIYYTFSISGIPSDATIDSVSCVARIYANNRVTTGTSTNAASIQLYNRTTAKGSAQTGIGRSAANVTISNTGSWTVSELNNIRLRIKGRRTNTSNSAYLYFYGADLTVNYSINGTEYEVSFVNDSYDTTTDPSTTQYIMSGGEQEIKIYTPDVDGITVKDNNVDVTNSLVPVTQGPPPNEIVTAPNASYGFQLDTSDGYYKSQNKGVNYSAAVCRLNITAETQCTLTLNFVNYAEGTYDYGIIGKVDSSLLTTSAVSDTSAWLWAGSASTNNSTTVRTTAVTIPSGEHFVDIKFRKDDATSSNNDDFRFKYSLSDVTLAEPYYKYTISNISADHVISLEDVGGTFYNVNASSTYAGAMVSPSTQSIREGRSADVQIAVNNSYEIVVKDNGTTATNSLVQNATGYTYTVSNVQAIHNITIEEAPYSTVSVSSTYAGATGTANPSKVYNGRNSVVEIDVDHLYEIKVKDNNVDVTSSVVESQGESTNETFTPSEYVSSASSYDSVYNNNNPTNGVSDHTSTTRACVYSNTGSGAESRLTYKFNCSSIPENATITNVVCSAKTSVYQTTYFATRTVQLYHGDTAKGTATQITSTGSSGGNHNINGGSWTRSELNDISIVVLVTRSTSSPTSDASFSFWGATLRVDYTTPDGCFYTLTNVQGNHTVVIEEAPYYTISTANTYASASVSVSPTKVYSGSGVNPVVTLTVPNLYEVVVRDGNTDITSSFVGSNGTYTYTLTNVNANRTISVEEAPYYTVTVNNPYQYVTITTDPAKGYYGIDVNVRIETNEIDGVKIFDNGTNIMSSIISVGSGVYRYTINAIATSHTITVQEANRYGVTASSTYNPVTITPATANVIEGHSQTFVIEGDEETDLSADITLTDNGVDVTSQMVRAMGETGSTTAHLGTFDAESSDYVGIYNNYNYTNAEGNSAAQAMASTGSTRSSFYPATGEGQTITIVYNIPVTGVPEGATIQSVICSGVCSTAYAGSGYSFTSLQLYAGSTPKGEATSYTKTGSAASIEVVDGGTSWTNAELANAKLVLYGVRNDYNSNSDASGIRDNVNMHGADLVVSYTMPGGYTYTISNIQSAHTLVVSEVPATYYNVNASSSYAEATITPATQSIRHNHTAKLQISAASIYDIVVKDNGVNVTSELVANGTGFTYTTQKITAVHTITVEESASFTITTSSQYQDATISPASQSVRQGMSGVTYIEVGNPEEIAVLDNGTDVTDQLVLVSAGESLTASTVLGTFDSVNSQYVGIYSSYVSTNAEGKSSADGMANTGSTRSAFYPATGAGSELYVYYDFGEVTGIPEEAVIYNVSANVAVSTAYSGEGYDDVTVQLCIGTTPVGEPARPTIGQNVGDATPHVYDVDGGTGWTMSDISNAKVLIYGLRNNTNSNNDANGTRDNLCIHGADLVVTYGDGETFNGYTYTLLNIQTAHTIVITENPQYTLTSQSQIQGVTVSPASTTVYGRNTVTFTIDGDISEAVVLDNNVDVTTQLRTINATSHTYTIASVLSAHTIVVTEPGSEPDYIKVGGTFKKILGFYKKINGNWTLIEKSVFDAQVSSDIVMYGGVVENLTIGSVEEGPNGALNITINDGKLENGTYRMVYEDVNKTPITGITDITKFTIS